MKFESGRHRVRTASSHEQTRFDQHHVLQAIDRTHPLEIVDISSNLLLSSSSSILFSLHPNQQLFFTPSSHMASIYCCVECGANLSLSAANLFPPDFYFEAGNKGSYSFSKIDESKVRFEKEDKIRPFFETVDYWGIHRNRTKIKCNACGFLLGHVYDDGPPMTNSPGQFHFGPSQVIPRAARYRLKTKALRIASET